MQLSLDIHGARALINTSERTFHILRQSPTFPQPILVGNRLRWLRDELELWLKAQPRVTEARPEPPQLKGRNKRSFIAPKPEAWPPPPGAAERTPRTQQKRQIAVADDASRSAETRSGAE